MVVLIIEDDHNIREACAQVLELEGYDVLCARDGREGLADARRVRPDLILLDLMMPVMDGWQFRAEQKRDPSIAGIPVVVVSACGRRPEIEAAAYIPKPCTLDDILDAVLRYAGQTVDVDRKRTEEGGGGMGQHEPDEQASQVESERPNDASPAAGPAVRDAMIAPSQQRDLYPFVIGGLLHDAVNAVVALEYQSRMLPEGSPAATRIPLGLERLSRVLRLMQDLSRVYYDPQRPQGEPNRVREVLASYQQTHHEITYALDEAADLDLPPGVETFLVSELLENATRACRGVQMPVVTLSIYAEADTTVVVCRDNGKGFPSDRLDQLGRQPQDLQTHRGYGLYLLSEIVHRLSGTIHFANREAGGGARVQILLPRRGTP